jgi:hypothetical protein
MLPAAIFDSHLVLGYVAWGLAFGSYIWPRLKALPAIEAQRAIATLHSFRFFGLVFLLPGVTGAHLPAGFPPFAAYGDFATGVLAMLALLTIRMRPLFWLFVVAYTLVGVTDLVVDYYHGVRPRGRRIGRDLLDPDPLCAAPDDHARRCALSPGAPAGEQDGSATRGHGLGRAASRSSMQSASCPLPLRGEGV